MLLNIHDLHLLRIELLLTLSQLILLDTVIIYVEQYDRLADKDKPKVVVISTL